MKLRLSYTAFLTSILLLQACGGGGGGNLLSDDSDRDPLVPPPGVDDGSDRPRPPENAAVITTDEIFLYDVANAPTFLRGIDLNFAEKPVERINGITAISDTGANVVRLQLDANTTDVQLEGALAKVVENGMLAVISLVDAEKLQCVDNNEFLLSAVDDLWLNKWLPVIAQDRFQSRVMINIASGWGPANIFNSDSLGYAQYIDTYKALIRKFRLAGFKLPLVIDAPGCGSDYNAFVAGRAQELLAADQEKNIVLSVNANGSRWNTGEKVLYAATQLTNQGVPYILSGISGSGVGENPVDHMDIIKKSKGDSAVVFNVPWQSTEDMSAYVMNLDDPIDLRFGSAMSLDVYLSRVLMQFVNPGDGKFKPTGEMSVALYAKDANGNVMRVGATQAKEIRPNAWHGLRYDLPRYAADPSMLLNGSTDFDLSAVTAIGFQVLANGKPVNINGQIGLDDLQVYPGVQPVFMATFDSSVEGWSVAWGPGAVGQQDGALTVMPTDAGDFALALPSDLAGAIDFDRELTAKINIFLPSEYSGDALWLNLYGQFGADWSGWGSAPLSAAALVPGQWTELTTTFRLDANLDFTTVQRFGLQVGGYVMPKTQPILIDSFIIEDPLARPTKTIIASQYKASFSSGTEGFEPAWGTEVTVTQADGELLATVPVNSAAAVNKADIKGVQEVDFSGGISVKARIFVPEGFTGENFWLKFFFQDGQWNHMDLEPTLTATDLTEGEWNDVEFSVNQYPANFSRSLSPNMFAFQVGGNAVAGTVKLDDIEILGEVKIDDTQPMLTYDFSTPEQFARFTPDISLSTFDESVLFSSKMSGWKIVPYGWIATTWIGSGESEALSISSSEDLVQLTERGEEVVNGEGGIAQTSIPANVE